MLTVWGCLLLMLVFLFNACTGNTPSNNNTTVSDSASAEEPVTPSNPVRMVELVTNGKANYKIIISENATEELMVTVNSLKSKLREITGEIFYAYDDYTKDGQPIDGTGEIVIGDCKRTEAQNELATLRYKDYTVKITESNILIMAHNDANTRKAINAFIDMLDQSNIESNGETISLKWTGDILHRGNYVTSVPTLADVPLSSFTIVYPSDITDDYAMALREAYAKRFGDFLPVVSDATPETPYEILLGKTNRTLSQSVYAADMAPDYMEYYFTADRGKLLVASGGLFSLEQAVEQLGLFFSTSSTKVEDLIAKGSTKLLTDPIQSCTVDYRFMSYNILVEYEGWGSGGDIPPEVEIRKEITASLILNYKPDVACLQEVYETWHANLPELIESNYGFVEATRTDGSKNRTLLIYNKSRLKVVKSGYLDLEDVVTSNKRVVVWAVFEDLETSARFAAFGTHWSSVGGEEVKVVEAGRTAELVKQITAQYSVPSVMMGDLNSVGEAVTAYATQSGHTKGVANGVDHIFYSSDTLQLVYQETVTGNCAKYASDHRPIFFDVNLK